MSSETKHETKKHAAPHAPAHRATANTSHATGHKPRASGHGASAAHTAPAAQGKAERYREAVGRRKTAIARVRLFAGSGKMTVNGKDFKHYFNLPRLVSSAMAPLSQMNLLKQFDVTVKVVGGGVMAQAEAVRHGISRAIILHTPEWKSRLRAMGYLTRDSRMVERKKYGLRKARRAPQWAKR